MSKTTKTKIFFDPRKELAFLEQMNGEGWKLTEIRFGCRYTFEEAEKDEYTTRLYADRKDNVLNAQATAAGHGFESVPHSFDGLSGLLYLTGKKGEADEDFGSDDRAQARHLKAIGRRSRNIALLFALLDALLLLEAILFTVVFARFFIGMCVFLWLLAIAVCVISVNYFAIAVRMNKKR